MNLEIQCIIQIYILHIKKLDICQKGVAFMLDSLR